ncbi:MAG: hypothetical protein ACI9CA_002446, partial [Natronomonas sp.]
MPSRTGGTDAQRGVARSPPMKDSFTAAVTAVLGLLAV